MAGTLKSLKAELARRLATANPPLILVKFAKAVDRHKKAKEK